MNYRHIFHAGNMCDVVKHATLALVLDYLRAKDKPFFVLDTHAGIGLYDLNDPQALKTGEAECGVKRLWDKPPGAWLTPYLNILRQLNPQTLQLYPGSPMLAQMMMRPADRLVACELHSDDVRELRRNMREYGNCHIHHRDGYEALRAFLPPPEQRGLVLIDPPFEQPDEFTILTGHLTGAVTRWPQGIFMVWYPIKERPALWHFHETLVATGIPKILCAEFIYHPETRHDRLNGSGLIIVNPPWQLDSKLEQLFADLHIGMQTGYRGITVKWLSAQDGQLSNAI